MIDTNINIAQKHLIEGDLVAIPTETVYGLAGNAFDVEAVLKIFTVKNRPHFDPLIVHSDSLTKIETFVASIPKPLRLLADAFWPGPLTLILPRKSQIPDLITAGLDTVAVRIPNHSTTLRLLASLPFPLAAPSANPFGYISPTTAQHVADQLGNEISYILDGGACGIGVESTIVAYEYENNEVIVLRLGGTPVEAIEQVVGKVRVNTHSSSNPTAPGMLKSHYSPRKKLIISNLKELSQNYSAEKIGCLTFNKYHSKIPTQNQRVLSVTENFEEAARHLFDYMRQLDALDIDIIVAELLPEIGLGRAINDRIRRAAV